MHIHCLQTTGNAQLKRDADQIIEGHWCNVFIAVSALPHLIIGSSSRICWQVTMCARVDTGKKTKIKAKENII